MAILLNLVKSCKHSQTRIFFAQISCKRHLFRSSANKEICDLEAIRRAVIFYLNFVINMPRTMTA